MTRKWTYRGQGLCGVCSKPATSYYDMTCGPLGDFREHCEECRPIVTEECRLEELDRNKKYQELKEWHNNYVGVPMDEI